MESSILMFVVVFLSVLVDPQEVAGWAGCHRGGSRSRGSPASRPTLMTNRIVLPHSAPVSLWSRIMPSSSSSPFAVHHHQQQEQSPILEDTTTTSSTTSSNRTGGTGQGIGKGEVILRIEYCPGCRWMTKAFWLATELLFQQQQHEDEEDNTTTTKDDNDENADNDTTARPTMGRRTRTPRTRIHGITIIPSTAGTFKVTAVTTTKDTGRSSRGNRRRTVATAPVVLWDRTIDAGFPPMDLQEFQTRFQNYSQAAENEDDDDDTASTAAAEAAPEEEEDPAPAAAAATARITIRYCPHAHYLFRAVYYGQELCTTFTEGELQELTLRPTPSTPSSMVSPVFTVGITRLHTNHTTGNTNNTVHRDEEDEVCLWNGQPPPPEQEQKTTKTGTTISRPAVVIFPEVKVLKRLVRDYITPKKDLGHSDTTTNAKATTTATATTTTTTHSATTTTDLECKASSGGAASLNNGNSVILREDIDECLPCNSKSNNNEDDDVDDDDDEEDDETVEEMRRYFGVL